MSNLESNEYDAEFQQWLKRNDPLPPTPVKIAMAKWDGCDTYMGCSQCGDGELDEGPPVSLHRNRTELCAVDNGGALVPVCVGCAQWHDPELVEQWWEIDNYELQTAQAALRRPPYFIANAHTRNDDPNDLPF